MQTSDGALAFADWRSSDAERTRETIEALALAQLGVTGCGAAALLSKLAREREAASPSSSWPGRGSGRDADADRSGAPALISWSPSEPAPRRSGSTATLSSGWAARRSAAARRSDSATRLGVRTAEELNALGLRGDRGNVDLMVGDLFEDVADVGALIASSFGKLARRAEDPSAEAPAREDLAAAILGIVSDNIGLLAGAYAQAAGVDRIVYGG